LYVLINDNNLYYEIHGQENEETIFFIHGGPGIGDCREDIKAFSQLGDHYKLVFVDMRGSGRSEDQPPFTHGQWTVDIDELRRELGIEEMIIMGGAYGGFLALEYVLRYPQYVTRLILRATSANFIHFEEAVQKALESRLPRVNRKMLDRLFGGKVNSNDELKGMLEALLPLYTVEHDKKTIKERSGAIYYRYETHNFAFHENILKYNLTDKLKYIKLPVLITVGKYDWISPVKCSENLASLLENARLCIFNKSGHYPHLEENEKYIGVIRRFLSEKHGLEETHKKVPGIDGINMGYFV
jgi:proline iminopeptidase